jgi:hypothetical protein
MDELTLLTLRVIALEEALKKIPDYKIGISNLSVRLTNLENSNFLREIEILAIQVKTNKKLIDEINEERLNKEAQKDAKDIKEMRELSKKKFSIMDWFKWK